MRGVRTATRGPGKINILYFGVRDIDYPRNERIRRYLEKDFSATVSIIYAETTGPKMMRYGRQLKLAWLGADRSYDFIILSEFAIHYWIFAWLCSKLSRARLIVDFFVGLQETQVGDFGTVRQGSIRAATLSLLDRLALQGCSVALTDTVVRARRFTSLSRGRTHVVPCPVGAPAWARPSAVGGTSRDDAESLRLLYYGNYLPLHGLESVVRALLQAPPELRVSLILVGKGSSRRRVENLCEGLPAWVATEFIDYLEPHEIHLLVQRSDLVLGIFGSSMKAREVIANKVWQALYIGKPILTRSSLALDEIREITLGAIFEVADADPIESSILKKILEIYDSRQSLHDLHEVWSENHARLEEYVESKSLESLRFAFRH